MVKKIRHSLIASVAAAALLLTACSNSESEGSSSSASSAAAGESSAAAEAGELKIEDNFGEKDVTLPVERAAVTDNRAFEILADWDVNVVAAPKKIIPDTLQDGFSDVEVDLGNHREPDLESLVAADPDLVWNGQRFGSHQEDIEKLLDGVPVLNFEPRDDKDFASELKRHTTALGEVFQHESEAEQLIADFDAAVERAKKAYDPSKKVMAVNTTGGEIGYIAPSVGRTYGPLFDLVGMTPALEVANATDDHEGDDISVEAIAESNPDWILVMDRDGAVASDEEGYTPGGDLVKENAALQNVNAVKEDQVYVAPSDTYTNENIITYTEILNAMADAFEAQK